MAGISDKALNKLSSQNKFNGGIELEEDYGVNLYSTFYRQYDPQLGRFSGVDIRSEEQNGFSTYHFAGNNPITFNDPLGDRFGSPRRYIDQHGSRTYSNPLEGTSQGNMEYDWLTNSARSTSGFEDAGGGGGGWFSLNKVEKEKQRLRELGYEINGVNFRTRHGIFGANIGYGFDGVGDEVIVSTSWVSAVPTDYFVGVMLDPHGAYGAGHMALMIGRKGTDWTFISKEG